MIWVTVFIVIVVVGAAVPVLHERGRQSMTPDLRKQADGKFAKLSAGQTHFRWSGGARAGIRMRQRARRIWVFSPANWVICLRTKG